MRDSMWGLGLLMACLLGCASAPESRQGASVSTPSAAQQDEAGAPALDPFKRHCHEARVSWALGEIASEELQERARVDAGAAVVRVVREGDAVTMDFHPARLNIEIDHTSRVRRLSCG